MRARVPKFSSAARKQMLSEVEIEVKKAWEKIVDEQTKDITRRVIKTIIYVLHTEYGYGPKRMPEIFKSFTEMIDKSRNDEVYWEHIDRDVIDSLRLPFERDYTDRGKAVTKK